MASCATATPWSSPIPAWCRQPGFAGDLHASALAFEFSHGSELILGSCGPAPADLPDSKALFRQGVAHSGPTIDAEDAVGQRRRRP